jgi:hypothetical protein
MASDVFDRPPSPGEVKEMPPGWRHFLAQRGWLETPTWATYYVHGLAAYRLYMQDRLAEAAEACEAALTQGLQGKSSWLARLLYEASAELEARDSSRRVEQTPFIFELPGDSHQYDGLVALADRSATRIEKMLGFERPKTMFTVLPVGSLIRYTDAAWGYMAPKDPYFKICLPASGPRGARETAPTLVHEYTHVAVYELSDWKVPRWLSEGLAQWMEAAVLGDEEEPVLGPDDLPRLGTIEGRFSADGDFEGFDPREWAYDAALAAVKRLIAVHGEYDVREFLARLAKESEGRAFQGAFGQSERQFEREWHERLKAEREGR